MRITAAFSVKKGDRKMKNFKKLVTLTLILATLAALFSACVKPVVQTDTEVVIVVKNSVMSDVEGKFLVDYLDALKEDGKLTYQADDGMVVKINDVEAKASESRYWMIYTDDADNSNEAWGTYEYDGKTYSSATLGIEDLPLKADATYIFAITQF